MYLAIDQYGNKTILQDKRHQTLKDKFFCGRIRKMFRDSKDSQGVHVGYVLGQGHGNASLWVELFKLEPMEVGV